jgi:hypothetical protein
MTLFQVWFCHRVLLPFSFFVVGRLAKIYLAKQGGIENEKGVLLTWQGVGAERAP